MDVVEQALDWLSQDPDPVTRDELQALIDATTSLSWRIGSPAACSSARPACAARSAPVPTG